MARTDTTESTETDTGPNLRGGAIHVPRSRGALSGFVLLVLGAWGALIPFIGPYFNFSFTPDTAWHWTSARFWLEVLPGAVAFLGGLLSLVSANRAVIGLGGWLGVAAGAWFVIGRDTASWLKIGSPGAPAGTSTTVRTFETLALFSGLGALIIFFGAFALGRASVHSVRDVRAAERRASRQAKKDDKLRGPAYEAGRRDGLAEGRSTDQDVRREDETTDGASVPAQQGHEQPVQQATYEQPAQQPMYQQPAQQPTYQQPAQQPTYQQPAQPPTQQPTTAAPTEDRSRRD